MKWKLVPVDPTKEMLNAALIKMMSEGVPISGIYASMLDAAPQPPKLSDERILELVKNHNYGSGCFYLPDGEKIVDFIRAIEREILGGGHE